MPTTALAARTPGKANSANATGQGGHPGETPRALCTRAAGLWARGAAGRRGPCQSSGTPCRTRPQAL